MGKPVGLSAGVLSPTRIQVRLMSNGKPSTLLADILYQSADFTLPQGSGTRAYRVDVDFGNPRPCSS